APTLPSMADSPEAAEMVVAQAMDSFAVGWSGMVGGWAAKLAARPHEDFDPATRQRVEEARAQMTAMLQDPAVANTPTAKFLEAFLQDGASPSP
ncbi:MAG TPA: hypothetical protein VF065_07045, partial [Ilumatobacter sp.]